MLKNWMNYFFYIGRASGQVCIVLFVFILANILWVEPILSFLIPNIPSSFLSAQVEKWHNQL